MHAQHSEAVRELHILWHKQASTSALCFGLHLLHLHDQSRHGMVPEVGETSGECYTVEGVLKITRKDNGRWRLHSL